MIIYGIGHGLTSIVLGHSKGFWNPAVDAILSPDSTQPTTASPSYVGLILGEGCGADRQRRLRGAVSITAFSRTSTTASAGL